MQKKYILVSVVVLILVGGIVVFERNTQKIDEEQAKDIALQYLEEQISSRSEHELVLINSVRQDDGWLFEYNTKAFFETGDFMKSIPGTQTFLVTDSGEIKLSPLFKDQ